MSSRIIIEHGSKSKSYWKDIWNYRGLLYFLAWRDVLVRYKQTSIGIIWSLLKPLLTIAVMWFFGKLFKVPVPPGVPRILVVCAATLPWQFFSSAFSDASNSLLVNSNLLTKVYFPRLLIPISSVLVCLIDFLISFAILVMLLVAFRFNPGWKICFLPLFLGLAFIMAMGTGLFIAAMNVKFRDFRYIVPFIVQFGLYVSPVGFSSDFIYKHKSISEATKIIYSMNPMVGVIDGFRWCILGNSMSIYIPGFITSVAISVLSLILGVWYFRKTEKSFADVI